MALPAVGLRWMEARGEESGVVNTSEGPVRFTLYWPRVPGNARTLVIVAADVRAAYPRPLRLLAQAAATSGFPTVYLEPSEAPAEAAARLKALLERHGGVFGLDAAAVWTYVEGKHFAPATPRCSRHTPLARTLRWLGQGLGAPSARARTVLELASGAGCALARHL